MSPATLFWTFLPNALLPLAIVGIGLLVIVGVLPIGRAVGLIGTVIISILSAPLVSWVFSQLPWWLAFLIIVWFGLAVVRGVLGLFLGDRAAGHAIGEFFVLGVLGGFRVLAYLAVLPFRVAGAVIRAAHARRQA